VIVPLTYLYMQSSYVGFVLLWCW